MTRKPSSWMLLLAASGSLLALSAGCGKSEAAISKPEDPAKEPASVAASSKADTDSYAVEVKADGPYKAGAPGAIELILKTKGGYHMNDQYPYKFKVKDPPAEGVSYPKAVLDRSDFKFSEENKNNPDNKGHKFDTAKVAIPFMAARPGRTNVAGALHMSVCSDENCIIDKVALELIVDVN